jgi:non-lysosomal glucosylceramidase
MFSLFQIPAAVLNADPAPPPIPAGGLGGGHFILTAEGEFRCWRMNPGEPETDLPVPQDLFHLWYRQGTRADAFSLRTTRFNPFHDRSCPLDPLQCRLFPFTWTAWRAASDSGRPAAAPPILLETLSFSPLMPHSPMESGLPVYVIVWRAHNPTQRPLEAALMLTWACGWPDLVPNAVFDFQHDNLCLTGSLGDPAHPERQGIAVPDLHYEGIYQQGIEPWEPGQNETEVWADFAQDGELDPAVARARPQGAAAWVKFNLDPQETKEIPFVLAWHFPDYKTGAAAGRLRYYTQFLGKRRPDNAIVWLAEQAVQNYHTETPQYRHWIQQIEDWHRRLLNDPRLSPGEAIRLLHRLASRLEQEEAWTEDDALPDFAV